MGLMLLYPTMVIIVSTCAEHDYLWIFNRVAPLKSNAVIEFSHSTTQVESKNTWVDPDHLYLGMRLHSKL